MMLKLTNIALLFLLLVMGYLYLKEPMKYRKSLSSIRTEIIGKWDEVNRHWQNTGKRAKEILKRYEEPGISMNYPNPETAEEQISKDKKLEQNKRDSEDENLQRILSTLNSITSGGEDQR